MENLVGPERKSSNLDFTESVTKIVDSAKHLVTPDKDNLEFTVLDINKSEQLVIHTQEIDKQKDKLYKKLGKKPLKVKDIQIWYSHLQSESGEPVNLTLNFRQEEWKNKIHTNLVQAGTRPSKVFENPPRLKNPPKGIYPIKDRDTIDWSKIPPRTPVNEEEAIRLLEKIQEKVSVKSSGLE